MKQIWDQQQSELSRLLERRRALGGKAERCVEELNWRLNPAGGPVNIEIEKAEQAMQELLETIRELRKIRVEIEKFPADMHTFYQGGLGDG